MSRAAVHVSAPEQPALPRRKVDVCGEEVGGDDVVGCGLVEEVCRADSAAKPKGEVEDRDVPARTRTPLQRAAASESGAGHSERCVCTM
jgi:hypothetical protein